MKHKIKDILNTPFVDLECICKNMENKQQIMRLLEGIAINAGMTAAYIMERDGYGCGDQGHRKAVRSLNKAGKIIWTKAFGYNAYHDLSF